MPKQLSSIRKAVEMICPHCSNSFRIAPSLIRCKNTFCSAECSAAAKQMIRVTKQCLQCGDNFETTKTKLTRGEGKYCGRECYSASYGTSEERMLARRNIVPESGCWEYTASLDSSGYGQTLHNGKHVLNHRLSAHLYLGFDLADKHCICHKCDNPKCFNPEHLFVGDIAANNRDKGTKGRQTKGTANHSKLTEHDVREIRRRQSEGETQASLAREFGVAGPTISYICARKKWAHVV